MDVPGYRIQIHHALCQPMLVAGVPRKFAILNATICAALTFGLYAWYAVPVCLIAHVAGMMLTKRDPYFFQTIVRHIRQKTYYRV